VRVGHGGAGHPGITAHQALTGVGYELVKGRKDFRRLVGRRVTGVGPTGLHEFAVTAVRLGVPLLQPVDEVTGALDAPETANDLEKQGFSSFYFQRPQARPAGPGHPHGSVGYQMPPRVLRLIDRLPPDSYDRRILEYLYAHPEGSFDADELIDPARGPLRGAKRSAIATRLAELWRHNNYLDTGPRPATEHLTGRARVAPGGGS
jgi:hypothetical protein